MITNQTTVTIPSQPYDFACDLNKTALVIIDMQNDFCANGGFGEMLGNDITNTKSIIPTIKQVLDQFRAHNLTVVHTREGHEPDLSDCPESKLKRSKRQGAGIGDSGSMGRILIKGEKGHAIVEELTPEPGEIVIDKPGKGAFYQTNLLEELNARGIESLIVTGVTTHVCVHSTVREANDRGFDCLVLEDGTAAFDEDDQQAAIRMFHQQGAIFGWVSHSAKLLEQLK
ncbi:cysteine hydrolase [Gracilibacillus oryzae]|uniref:Cysteine hydrolase n=1 Tax=Gracilibacillus oryzae TaxID=1672701 RepID=A0A7C8L6P6_9BACI|nr:isochorismatase family cysteine hydrolase [Gracilibacillus oryzae]KAB8133098.1 cysteine hydrolase [Gracilibacillus oryzae]